MKLISIRAALGVAAVYGYFLLFAQFSFVGLLRGVGMGSGGEKLALGLMAAAGIGGGFFIAWRGADSGWIRCALGASAVVALIAPWAANPLVGMVVAVVTGAALGISTVGLAALLPGWCGVAWVGLGTGLGYACCNVPAVFSASPTVQAWIAANIACVGLLVIPADREWRVDDRPRAPMPWWAAIGSFTALVWLDSAAFFIIQHDDDLKRGTWGDAMLWRNAAMHLVVAVLAGQWLRKGGAKVLLPVAWGILAFAALAVNASGGRTLAGWCYPAGVSLYSTALVAWPGWLSGVDGKRDAAWRAAWLFGIAGWIGSANGIGMAETLHRVPVVFILASGTAVFAFLWFRQGGWRSPVVAGAVSMTALTFPKPGVAGTGQAPDAERGHEVYLEEGCIHCHSQYPRPGTADEVMWGRGEGGLEGHPVLIGNRRQGPDLRNIGARRSAAWLRLHFKNPRALEPDSTMPSYRYLFDDRRGEDLVAWLGSCGADQTLARMKRAAGWQPGPGMEGRNGAVLFARHCAVCHGTDGGGGGDSGGFLAKRPADLTSGPFVWTSGTPAVSLLSVERAIKFGIPGTDMPGHEVFTDAQVKALASVVMRLRSARDADVP